MHGHGYQMPDATRRERDESFRAMRWVKFIRRINHALESVILRTNQVLWRMVKKKGNTARISGENVVKQNCGVLGGGKMSQPLGALGGIIGGFFEGRRSERTGRARPIGRSC